MRWVDVSKEDLDGWHIHGTNGSVDNLAEWEGDTHDEKVSGIFATASMNHLLSYQAMTP